ncbi:MAG: Gfo/Idh/MocA family oxidoreductase [Bryobacteraceae bacterium]|nr:Gfo/Idh/MocA family oxidoreductase [Bryobacteraceae bacterium]MDW8377555.1 Gfo/Idh/MocA family oxidoreductase [Bryobacterales bacterium]
MTRRSFAGTAGPALLLPSGQIAGSKANSAIRMGLIGCGGRGVGLGTLLAREDRVRFTALCDLRPEQMEKAAPHLKAASAKRYRDYRELLNTDLDAVVIATPVYQHPEQLESAVLAGKHVYCEKPAAVDVEGCRRVIRAGSRASARQCIVFGFQNRYGPGYRKAETLIRSNAIGAIKLARSNWIASTGIGKRSRAPVPPDQEKLIYWNVWRQYSGDIIVEQNVHGVDVLNWFLGSAPIKAYGTGGRILRTYGDNLDHLNVTFVYPTGVHAVLTASQFGPNGYRVVSETFLGVEGVIETQRQSLSIYRNPKEVSLEKIEKDITETALEEFVQRILDHQPENTAARAAESTLTCILGRMAIDQKREVNWKELGV